MSRIGTLVARNAAGRPAMPRRRRRAPLAVNAGDRVDQTDAFPDSFGGTASAYCDGARARRRPLPPRRFAAVPIGGDRPRNLLATVPTDVGRCRCLFSEA